MFQRGKCINKGQVFTDCAATFDDKLGFGIRGYVCVISSQFHDTTFAEN